MENFEGKCLVNSTPGKGTKFFLMAPICLGKDSCYEKN